MTAENVLAWDFAKLEMELKVRLLPLLVREADVSGKLWEVIDYKPPKELPGIASPDSLAVERAGRLKAFLAFERLLDALTRRILSRNDAEPIHPLPCERETKIEKLDRLLCLLTRIRKEAAFWLGFEHYQRQKIWKDEYYFALAVYGLLNIRWDYEPPQAECALVAAGAAAALAPSTRKLIDEAIKAGEVPNHQYPSYRVPLALAHDYWKRRDFQNGCAFVEDFVLDVKSPQGPRELRVRAEMGHAVPLIAEAALLEMENDRFSEAEPLLKPLRPLARQLGDYETLGRIGRLFKDSGDRRWENTGIAFKDLRTCPAWQMYKEALSAYEEAFLATNDYYTGINAATLALLTHDPDKSRKYARRVAKICEGMKVVQRTDRYWVFATEGEAQLLLNNWGKALAYYRTAINELSPGQFGMADSAYKQLRRLRKAMEEHEQDIKPVLDLFESNQELSQHLSTDLLP